MNKSCLSNSQETRQKLESEDKGRPHIKEQGRKKTKAPFTPINFLNLKF